MFTSSPHHKDIQHPFGYINPFIPHPLNKLSWWRLYTTFIINFMPHTLPHRRNYCIIYLILSRISLMYLFHPWLILGLLHGDHYPLHMGMFFPKMRFVIITRSPLLLLTSNGDGFCITYYLEFFILASSIYFTRWFFSFVYILFSHVVDISKTYYSRYS